MFFFFCNSYRLSCSVFFFFSSRRRHTRCLSDWSSDVCSSDLVFRISPDCTKVDAVVTDTVYPNGLAFTPDESVLYVNDTRLAEIRAYDMRPDEIGRASCRERG